MRGLQGKFFDLRMQDVYNIVKCLQYLACATSATALVFVSCGGLSNLAAVLSWPLEGMRHARWAASVVMSDVSPYNLLQDSGFACWTQAISASCRTR